MEIFINELSLEEQLYDRQDFKEALKVFFSVFALLNQKGVERQIFKSNELLVRYNAVKNEPFLASLNTVADKSLARAIRNILFNKLNIKDWQPQQKHCSDDLFTLEDKEEIVTDTSMAELAEEFTKRLKPAITGMSITFITVNRPI